jgi:hypothetical protein
MHLLFSRLFFLFFLIFSLSNICMAQDSDDDSPVKRKKKKGFEFGISTGTYFANNYTASLYDGYGFNANGGLNTTFLTSAMYEKIVNEYGGGPPGAPNGQPDRIAVALGVQPGMWSFDTTDMPLKMKYNIALELGVQSRYFFNDKNALILNVNASQLTLSGDFTIGTSKTVIQPSIPDSLQFQTFSIVGQEERLIIQPGFQHIFGDDDQFNFFIEGGPIITMAKLQMNEIIVNNLTIDLRTYYNSYNGYITQAARNMTGIGWGAFAGFGMSIQANEKYSLQLVYNPSYEVIRLGPDPSLTLQQAILLRVCYKLQ